MSKRILIVDDEVSIVEMLSMRLEAAGYETEMAFDGQGALDKVARQKPDLIILDVMMPKMNGLEVCQRLKGEVETQDIFIVMVTALGQEEDKQKGEEVKADIYMTKPFDSVELMARLKEVLGE